MADEKILEKLKYLKLKGLSENWDETVKLATQQQLSCERFLSEIIEKEYALKKRKRPTQSDQKSRHARTTSDRNLSL